MCRVAWTASAEKQKVPEGFNENDRDDRDEETPVTASAVDSRELSKIKKRGGKKTGQNGRSVPDV